MDPKAYARQALAAVTLNAQRLAIQFETSSQRFTKAVTIAYLSGAQQTAAFMTRNDGEVTSQQIEKGLQEAGHLLGFELRRTNEEHIVGQTKPEEPTEAAPDIFKHWPRPWKAQTENGTVGNIEAANGEPVVQVQPLSPAFESDIIERNVYRQTMAKQIAAAVNAYKPTTAPPAPEPTDRNARSAVALLEQLISAAETTPAAAFFDFARQLAQECDTARAAKAYEPDAPALQAFAERNNLEDCSLRHLCQIVDDARTMENAPQDPKPSKD